MRAFRYTLFCNPTIFYRTRSCVQRIGACLPCQHKFSACKQRGPVLYCECIGVPRRVFAPVAQWIECLPPEQEVVSSNLTGRILHRQSVSSNQALKPLLRMSFRALRVLWMRCNRYYSDFSFSGAIIPEYAVRACRMVFCIRLVDLFTVRPGKRVIRVCMQTWMA